MPPAYRSTRDVPKPSMRAVLGARTCIRHEARRRAERAQSVGRSRRDGPARRAALMLRTCIVIDPAKPVHGYDSTRVRPTGGSSAHRAMRVRMPRNVARRAGYIRDFLYNRGTSRSRCARHRRAVWRTGYNADRRTATPSTSASRCARSGRPSQNETQMSKARQSKNKEPLYYNVETAGRVAYGLSWRELPSGAFGRTARRGRERPHDGSPGRASSPGWLRPERWRSVTSSASPTPARRARTSESGLSVPSTARP